MKYKFLAELKIENIYLPSPIKVVVGSNSTTYIDKFMNNKILSICKQYNYNGFLDIRIKYKKGKNSNISKTIFIDKDRISDRPKYYAH